MREGILRLSAPPHIISRSSVVGKHEFEGPLGSLFDLHDNDDRFGMQTWEQSEAEMQRQAFNIALAKAGLSPGDIDAVYAGDLMNQCISSAYGLLEYDVSFIGLYGACSTAAEALALAAMSVSAGYFERAAAVTSSHNCSAERQFRFPLEYGGQRTPTSQWTVTGSGAFVLCANGKGPRITEVMLGKTVDLGITDANNMGAAMAPAAADTILRYFKTSGQSPEDFSLIATGDLGREGHSLLLELTKMEGLDISRRCMDCGLLIYHLTKQDMHMGGSGCGCSAVALAAYLLRRLERGEYEKILFVGTGALMSPLAVKQGRSIPGVAHLVRIEA